jgi:hypothetical protein
MVAKEVTGCWNSKWLLWKLLVANKSTVAIEVTGSKVAMEVNLCYEN